MSMACALVGVGFGGVGSWLNNELSKPFDARAGDVVFQARNVIPLPCVTPRALL